MSALINLPNIGKELDKKLKSIEIMDSDELKLIGSKEAFVRLKLRYPNVCLVHLYALEGAVTGVDYSQWMRMLRRT